MPAQQSVIGVTITHGPQDWQIIQRSPKGSASVTIKGTWKADETEYSVQVRVVDENTNMPVTSLLDWSDARMDRDAKTFEIVLDIPQGGLYRIETRVRRPLAQDRRPLRGDCIHHIGVGDIYVIAGQSNASGTGKGAASDGPSLGVHLFANDEKWKLASHPLEDATGTLHPITITGIFHGHSPWLAFGKKILRTTGVPVGLIPCALGGSPIVRWLPDEIGDLFGNMADMVRKAGNEIAGILWIQGETETFLHETELYHDRFVRCIEAFRRFFGRDTLPVFVGQLNAFYSPDADDREWSRMREIQRIVCQADPNAHLVVTIDSPLSDEIHNSSSANIVIGERFADRVLEHYYGLPVQSGFPEPSRISFLDADRTRIQVDFANVAGDWTQIWDCRDFQVEDEQGWVEIYPEISCTQVILQLGRSAQGKTTVHGLYGATPRPTLFDDNGRCITPFSWTL